MEIRTQSKTGPVVPPLAELTATPSNQIDEMKHRLNERLNHEPTSFAQIEVEIHDRFRRLADEMTASLLAEATPSCDQAEPAKKGGAVTTDQVALRRRDG